MSKNFFKTSLRNGIVLGALMLASSVMAQNHYFKGVSTPSAPKKGSVLEVLTPNRPHKAITPGVPEVDVTDLIKNPGFDSDLTFKADGSIKDGEIVSSITNRSHKYVTEDGTIYAVAKTAEEGNQSWKRTDTEKSYNGFLGMIDGWTLAVPGSATGEWTYYGSVSYDLTAGTVGIADDNDGSWLTTSSKPEAANTEANTAALYLRAGWGNSAEYSQSVVLPSGDYRLEYWLNNTNYANTIASGLTDLCEVICGEAHFSSEMGINANGWEKRQIEFTSTGNVTIKMGFKAGNYGSGRNPILLIDDLKLYKIGEDGSTHKHDYASAWSSDETNHWHVCNGIAGECDAPKSGEAAHNYDEVATETSYYTCSVCQYEDATRKAEYWEANTIDITFDSTQKPSFEYYGGSGDWYLGWADNTNSYIIRLDYLVPETGKFGHYTIDDLDLDYSFLSDYSSGSRMDLNYTAADFTIADEGNYSFSLTGSVVCDNNKIYRFSGFYTDNKTIADAVVKKIYAIGTVEYTEECDAKIKAAREAYDALTDAQKALITAEQYKVLTDAEADWMYLARPVYLVDVKDDAVDINFISRYSVFASEFLNDMGAFTVDPKTGTWHQHEAETDEKDVEIKSDIVAINNFKFRYADYNLTDGEWDLVLPMGFFVYLNDNYDFEETDEDINTNPAEARARFNNAVRRAALNGEKVEMVPEIKLSVTVKNGTVTSVNSIEQLDANATVYDLAGRNVRNAKGVVILNGKKVLK